ELRLVLRRAAVDDARLVEMNMSFDQAGAGEPAAGVMDLDALAGRNAAVDRRDGAAADTDVGRAVAARNAHVTNEKVHCEVPIECWPYCMMAPARRRVTARDRRVCGHRRPRAASA